ILAQLERRAEHVRSNILTPVEDAIADHQDVPLGEHIDAYIGHLESKGTTADYRKTTERYLKRLAEDCSFSWLSDLDRTALERWLSDQTRRGRSARSRNAYRNAAVAFCNWCIGSRRLAISPFAGAPKAREKADPRRQHRALTEEELVKL
ncbi:site-specific integrase, partial [Planctomycetota bacterium]